MVNKKKYKRPDYVLAEIKTDDKEGENIDAIIEQENNGNQDKR